MFHASSRELHGIETDIAAFLHNLLILLAGIFGRENMTEAEHLLRVGCRRRIDKLTIFNKSSCFSKALFSNEIIESNPIIFASHQYL